MITLAPDFPAEFVGWYTEAVEEKVDAEDAPELRPGESPAPAVRYDYGPEDAWWTRVGGTPSYR